MSGPQVIVVGGGLSGMSAAHTILQAGGRVCLLDKSPFCGGNSTKATSGINAAGTRTQRALGIPDSPEVFEKDTSVSAMELARPELIKTLTHESGPAVEWLIDSFGLDLSVVGRLAAHSHPRTHRGKERFPGMAITYGLMEKLDEMASKHPDKARVINKATVAELIQEPSGEVVGCVYEKNGKKYKEYGPVIICTGGFGADFSKTSLLAQVSSEWDKLDAWGTGSRAAKQSGGKKVPSPFLLDLPTTNGVHCSGDGIKLAIGAGAGTLDLHCVQIHPTGLIDPEEPNAKVKFLAAEALRGSGAIILDRDGKRFCDELGKRDYVTGRMWLHGKAPYRLCLNSAAAKLIMWHCEHYEGRGLMKKMTGAELAKACKVSAQQLQQEFDVYNKAAQNPGTDRWDKKFFECVPVMANDSFYVAEITPVIHYCMGGVDANHNSEVLRATDKSVIQGLWVAGEAQGGVHGVNRLGGSSLLDCVVYGRVAGRNAAKYQFSKVISGGAGALPGGASLDGISIKVSPTDKSVTVSWGPAKAGAIADAPAAPQEDGPKEVDPNQAFYGTGNKPAAAGQAAPKAAAKPAAKTYAMDEIAKHNSKKDCWVVLHNKVFAITPFLDEHPGGSKAIMLYAGKDATKEFDMLHKIEIIDKYAMDYYIGEVAPSAKL